MNKSTIAIIVPCFNGEVFLEQTIKSVLSQSYKNFNLYLLNNGSTDNSLSIMKKYKKIDNRIKIINNRFKTSRAKSINTLLKKISNKIVSVIDADDIMLKNKTKIQIDYLKRNPNVKFLSCLGTYIADGRKTYGKTINQIESHKSCFELIKKGKNVGILTPGIIFYRSIFLKLGGFREKFWPCDDTDLWTRCAENKHIIYVIPKVLIKYRIHSNSITTSDFFLSRKKNDWVNDCLNRRLKKKNEITFNEYCKNLKKRKFFKKIFNYLDDNCDFYFRNSIIYIINNDFSKILFFLFLSFLHNPLRFYLKVHKRIFIN
jgi:glycosyltransferase involved in cell wall biosynthesis